MPGHLYSARAKFVWAHQKVKALNGDVERYREREPHFVSVEQDDPVTYFRFQLHVREPMPALEWGLRFGDCLQALRSSLDHAIVELAARKEGVWPSPASNEHRLMFPICDSPDAFKDALWRLGDLRYDTAVLNRVEGLQPYMRPPTPYRPLLTALRELNDRDKHRVVPLLRGWGYEMTMNIVNESGLGVLAEVVDNFGAVEDGAILLEIRFPIPQRHVKMKGGPPDFRFYPALEYVVTRRAEASGDKEMVAAVDLLRALVREVRYCLTGLRLLMK